MRADAVVAPPSEVALPVVSLRRGVLRRGAGVSWFKRPLGIPVCHASFAEGLGPRSGPPVAGMRDDARQCGRPMQPVKTDSAVFWLCPHCDRNPESTDWGTELLDGAPPTTQGD